MVRLCQFDFLFRVRLCELTRIQKTGNCRRTKEWGFRFLWYHEWCLYLLDGHIYNSCKWLVEVVSSEIGNAQGSYTVNVYIWLWQISFAISICFAELLYR